MHTGDKGIMDEEGYLRSNIICSLAQNLFLLIISYSHR
jgi:hypothetical protein